MAQQCADVWPTGIIHSISRYGFYLCLTEEPETTQQKKEGKSELIVLLPSFFSLPVIDLWGLISPMETLLQE